MVNTRSFLFVLVLAVLASTGAWLIARFAPQPAAPSGGDAYVEPRLVSLSPAMTQVLFAIGADPLVVGVSDYCKPPASAQGLLRAGTILTPNYEVLARLEPTLIVGDRAGQVPEENLRAIAETRLLPWLTLDEIAAGVRLLGQITDRTDQADLLASTLVDALEVSREDVRRVHPGAPRVLLALEHLSGQLNEVWFIKDHSLHGAVLRAAGGLNAVTDSIPGPPRLSLERVVEIDPDMVIVLSARPEAPDADRRAILDDWRTLRALRAVEDRRLGFIAGDDILDTGPGVLDLIERLRDEIERLTTGTGT